MPDLEVAEFELSPSNLERLLKDRVAAWIEKVCSCPVGCACCQPGTTLYSQHFVLIRVTLGAS